MKLLKSFIGYCFVVLLMHVALTQNGNQSVFNGTTFGWYAPQTAPTAQIAASTTNHSFNLFGWLVDVSEDVSETIDGNEGDGDPDQPESFTSLLNTERVFLQHTSKALIGVQHYLGRYTPFKQAPLFIIFHSWKSYLA